MANKSVFAAIKGKLLPRTDATNHEGAPAYRLTPHQALAQLAATGTFNATFYADAREQLDEVLKLAWQVEPDFLAKTAVHAFEKGYMKDMPALLLAVLSQMHGDQFDRAFGRIVKNGKPHDVKVLPGLIKAFEAFKRDPSLPVPNVPFQMLTSLPLTKEHWTEIAETAGWQMLRQNLNTFARHGVFEVEGFAETLARRLAHADEVKRSRVFPYQLMVAFANAGPGVPQIVRDALQDAMEVALANVPSFAGNVVVCPDVSGSMGSSVTGYRKGSTSTVRCIDVAALVAASVLRRNPTARVLPFENDVVDVHLNARDTVMSNAAKLAAIGGGGTNCSAPLARLVKERAKVDLVLFVSDNQSWVDAVGQTS